MRLESVKEVADTAYYLQPYDEVITYIGSASGICYAGSSFKRGQVFTLQNASNYDWEVRGTINNATSTTLLAEDSIDIQFVSTGFIIR